MFGIDDAVIAAAIAGTATAGSAAYSAASARDSNRANASINAMNAEQAQDFYIGNREETRYQNQLARDYNTNEAYEARGFSRDEAQKARDFSERMSGTQYQRAVGDMQAAGLNPMLAYSQGGAGTPGASQASSSQAAGSPANAGGGGQVPSKIPMAQTFNGTGFSALSVAQTMRELRQMDATTENIEADTAARQAQVPQSVAQTIKLNKEVDKLVEEIKLKQQEFETEAATTNVRKQEYHSEQQRTVLIQAQKNLSEKQAQLAAGEIKMQPLIQAYKEAQNVLMDYEKAEGAGRYKLNRSEYGQSGSRAWLDEAAGALGTALGGRRAARGLQ